MHKEISGYRNYPGVHCGSVAMRSLLSHYTGLELSESAVFGLGAGVASVLLTTPGLETRMTLFGRTLSMEADLARHLGVDYREQTEEDGALRKSRNPPNALSTHNLWGRFHSQDVGTELVDAARMAIETCSSSMLGLDGTHAVGEGEHLAGGGEAPQWVMGVAATRAFAEAVPSWADAEDGRGLASYNASCIEKFGNGGGNFRRLYSGFLGWAHALDPSLVPETAEAEAWAAADAWTAASDALFQASRPESDRAPFEEAAGHARRVADLEEALFTRLAD